MNIITNFFTKMFSDSKAVSDETLKSELIRLESQIGQQLFGPVPAGGKREFFCLDENTWVWHEESGGAKTVTKYMVQGGVVLKSINGSAYEKALKKEVTNLLLAAEIYQKRVGSELYELPHKHIA